MVDGIRTHLHPIERASALDGWFRRLIHNPNRILRKYVYPNMSVLDLGCGTGYFTIELANLTGENGKVIASEVQEGMIEILKKKLKGKGLKQIEIHKNYEDSLNITEKVDFILAFYSFHEMKYLDRVINDISRIVKSGTKIMISEQKFHVNKTTFNSIVQKFIDYGFEISDRPQIFLSRTVVMGLKK